MAESGSNGSYGAFEWVLTSDTKHSSPVVHLIEAWVTAWTFTQTNFTFICLVLSIFWLTYRATRVLYKPLDDLVKHLGFDFPLAPHVDLAGVKADGIKLQWKSADERKSTNRFEIQLNGAVIGSLTPSDTSATVTNLAPDHNYVARVVIVNAQEIRAASEPVRIKTKAADSGDLYRNLSAIDDAEDASNLDSKPIVRPCKTGHAASSSSVSAPAMAREISNGPVSKRNIANRRPSPATLVNEAQLQSLEDIASSTALDGNQHHLTEKLEEVTNDIREIEKSLIDEDSEAAVTRAELVKERDEARAILKEKDTNSRDLRKQMAALDRDNTNAQAKRTTQERILKEKKDNMQKIKDDTERWGNGAIDMRAFVKQCEVDKETVFKQAEEERHKLQEQVAEDAQALKSLEDEVRERSLQHKRLEQELHIDVDDGEGHEAEIDAELEEDRRFEDMMRDLEARYREAVTQREAAARLCHEQTIRLNAIIDRNRLNAAIQSSYANDTSVSRHNSARQRQMSADHYSLQERPSSAFQATAGPSFLNGTATASEAHEIFGPPAPSFFNALNGMTLDTNRDHLGMSAEDVERLTAGAPMSPSAGADLLPADLLSAADDEPPRQGSAEATGGALPGLGAFTGAGPIPGLGVSNVPAADFSREGPASPVSASSRSPSVFASPQASTSNLAFHSPDPALDADGKSIRSNRSFRPASGGAGPNGSRFAQILGFGALNRQRGKTWTDDGLALGKIQSQSMPKDAVPDDLLGSASKRRNSSHSGNFFRIGSSKAGGDNNDDDDGKASSPTRKAFMGLGGSNGWGAILGRENRPGSPRPGSTHSTELPKPKDQKAGWAFWPGNASFANRSSNLSSDWPPQQQQRIWGSRYPSRRPSAQIGPSGGVAYDIQEDEDDVGDGPARPPPQAPIGTKPASLMERPVTPQQLNPAAKDFKSLFSFNESKKDKPEKSSKGKGKEATLQTPDLEQRTPTSAGTSPMLGPQEDQSPPQSRKSRDTHSIMTAESSTNDGPSRNSLERTPSHQLIEIPTPTSSVAGSSGKASFMRKLSRKSSSGKFTLPGFQRDKKNRNAEKSLINEEAPDTDDSAMMGSVGDLSKSMELDREEKKGSVRNWSSVFSIGKGKDKKESKDAKDDKEKTPSVSEASLTSASEIDGREQL